MLFVIGGNGTHAGANAINDEVVSAAALCCFAAVVMFCNFLCNS